MIKINYPIVVEGIYDRQKLQQFIDAFIIETNGFNLFSNREKREFLKKLADNGKIIVMTDSDSAGFKIRNYIGNICNAENIINVYIPDVFGKEKRKTTRSKEGKIGVEGIDEETIILALEKSGVFATKIENENRRKLTSADLMNDKIAGTFNSQEKKNRLLEKMGLPERMSNKQLIRFVNDYLSYEKYREYLKQVESEENEN